MTVDLITRRLSDYQASNIDSIKTLKKGMIHFPGGREVDSIRRHPTTQNNVQTYVIDCG